MVLSNKSHCDDLAEYYSGVFRRFYRFAFGIAILYFSFDNRSMFKIIVESELKRYDRIGNVSV